MGSLQQFTADHRYLKSIIARQAEFSEPVLVDATAFYTPLLGTARVLATLPIDGVAITSWECHHREVKDEVLLGMRLYQIEHIRFAVVAFQFDYDTRSDVFSFLAVDRGNYEELRRLAQRLQPRPKQRPILTQGQADLLWDNTIGYLEPASLERIQRYGGRAHRGVLLTGAPGNGKTMACRWICDECRERGWQWRLVTPDTYRQARQDGDVQDLFTLADRGLIFFDDMDQALRRRDQSLETEDQSVFLTALDGMRFKQGVVFVFTTNCPLEQIDRAFKRPGRIDVVFSLGDPDADMRRQLVRTWHAEIREHLDENRLVASTDGYTFAELEEIKNLLVMRRLDAGSWDWNWAVEQFTANRNELAERRQPIGFGECHVRP